MQSCYISYQCTRWKSPTCSLTSRPPRSMFTMWKHGRVAQLRRVGEKMSGPRPRPSIPPPWKNKKNKKQKHHLCSVCITSIYLSFLSARVFSVCLKLSLSTHTTVSSNTLTRVLSFDLCWTLGPITCWPENAPKKIYIYRKKGKKKLPISVFPTSVECHRQVFFFSHHYT